MTSHPSLLLSKYIAEIAKTATSIPNPGVGFFGVTVLIAGVVTVVLGRVVSTGTCPSFIALTANDDSPALCASK